MQFHQVSLKLATEMSALKERYFSMDNENDLEPASDFCFYRLFLHGGKTAVIDNSNRADDLYRLRLCDVRVQRHLKP